MAKDDIGGVWRTIGGRRVFIKDGQSLEDAMKASGKFNKKKSPVVENAPDEVADYLYKETGRDIVSKTEIDDYIREDFLDDELRDYRDKVTEEEYKAVYKELEKRGYKINYDEDNIKGPESKEVKEINDKVTKDWGSSELEDTRKALASAERYLEKHPDDERMKKRVELHKKDIERLEKQESSGNKNHKNIEEDIAKEKADYYKNKAEEYKNTKDPMFEDIKGKRAEEYQQKWEETMREKYMNIPEKERVQAYVDGKNWKDFVKEKDYQKYNKWLKSQGIDKQLTEQEYNKMSQETEKINNKGLERSIEMEKDNLARRKANGDSVKNISNMTRNIHDMELEKQKSDGRLTRLEKGQANEDRRIFNQIAKFYGYDKMDNDAIRRTLDDAEKKGLYHSKGDIEAMRRYLDKTLIEKDTGSAYSNPGKRWEILEENTASMDGSKIYKVQDGDGNVKWMKASAFYENENKSNNQISDTIRRKAYQKYLKEHPNSKMKFEDFIK